MSTSIYTLLKLLAAVKNPLPPILDRLGLPVGPYCMRLRDGTAFDIRPHRGDWYAFNEVCLWNIYSFLGERLSPGDRVMDVGANIGCFAVRAARAVGPTGKVIAIEPEIETFRQLERNISLNNLTNVVTKQVAMAKKRGTATLHLASNAVYTSLFQEIADRSTSKDVQEVATITLDDILEEYGWDRCQLLKLDCEGAEHEIIGNMTAETASKIDRIALEIHQMAGVTTDNLIDKLKSFGFSAKNQNNIYFFWRAPAQTNA